jgi:predicted nucleotidyltransferase
MELQTLIAGIVSWAETKPDIVGVALVGSCARDLNRKESDIDLMLLTVEVGKYFQSTEWLSLFGDCRVSRVDVYAGPT